jgi:ComF family protein
MLYAGPALQLIHAFKYKNRTCLAAPFGSLLYLEFIQNFDPDGIDAVLPVPLHQRRLRARGYNQSLLLIRQWAKIAQNMGHTPEWQVFAHDRALCRKTHTPPQTGMNRNARIRNIQGAFMVRDPTLVAGMHLLLVDDVLTTGSTVNECARVLRRAGAASVSILTLARAS